MSNLLKQPNEIDDAVVLNMVIYGQPGTGKTTLALSAPDPVDIDADLGMKRVEKRFQTTSLPLENYDHAVALLEGTELAPFKTIVIDTLGKFIERMADSLIAKNPKNRRTDSAQPSMQGWGAIKSEFQSFLRKAKKHNKHLIFVAHEKEDKDGDNRIVRPDVMGSSGKDLVKELDIMGYVQMRGDERTISFSPDERYYAKNSLKLPRVIVIPNTDTHPNDFITRVVLGRAMERQKEAGVENEKYTALLTNLDGIVKTVTDAKTADEALATINMSPPMWDSHRVAKKRLQDITKSLGLIFDKDAKAFVKGTEPAEEKPADTSPGTDPNAPPSSTNGSGSEPTASTPSKSTKVEGKKSKKSATADAPLPGDGMTDEEIEKEYARRKAAKLKELSNDHAA